jgi:hypothetical protein
MQCVPRQSLGTRSMMVHKKTYAQVPSPRASGERGRVRGNSAIDGRRSRLCSAFPGRERGESFLRAGIAYGVLLYCAQRSSHCWLVRFTSPPD